MHLLLITMSQSSDRSELEEGFQFSLLAPKLILLLKKRLETVGSGWEMRAWGLNMHPDAFFLRGGLFAVLYVPW